ncbi:WD repeat-containing protein 43 [Nephila pilipes]|uniref:WD repeat-containing protein 43 n=1 Tax=Nephila pilipes TaxID=299642 RepID=A0A8X6P261_NEPPI|nr:WD repeat-containing protein 43 [Nephila pilipes]
MISSRHISAFSRCGEYFVHSTPDGCLKIWETSTGILLQEFTPSSHLSATCSTLGWGPTKRKPHLPKKPKKSRNETSFSIENLQLIAIGTVTGNILLYSFSNADLHSCLDKGHISSVNDVCWSVATNSLFTCSNDKHVIQWEISSGKIKTKWEADKIAVYCICVIDDKHIVSAGSSIQIWDIQQKCVIRNFEGHATEICRVLSPQTENKSINQYFISSAVGDRIINAWQIDENTKGAVASFISLGEPDNIVISFKENEPFRMSVVTRDGLWHLFEHSFNGKLKKPLSPKINIQIATIENNQSKKPCPVPIIAANISEGLDSCVIVYGSFLAPVFERIDISDISKDLVLIRDISFSSTVSIEDFASRIKKVEKTKNVKMLAPGRMTDVSLVGSISKKRKKQKDIDLNKIPIEEHLRALDLGKTAKSVTEEPTLKSDSMVHLLLQGLQSKDKEMLNTVFRCVEKTVIVNTIRRLPLQSILLVLEELYGRLNEPESRNHPCLRWLIELLTIHLPYLMSCKDIGDTLGPISQLIDARVENFPKMRLLQAGLKMLLSQAKTNISITTEDPSAKPLIEYESESSNDSEVDDMNVSETSSEQAVDDILDDESESSSSESDLEA